MNILGIGAPEILLIVILALIVFGPARLPEIMAQVGKAIADFRRATSELSDEFNKTIQTELRETRAVVDGAKSTVTDLHSTVTDIHASVNSAVTGLPAPVRTAVPAPLEPLPVANGTAAQAHPENGVNSSVAATPPPPAPPAWSWETSGSPPAAGPSSAGAGNPPRPTHDDLLPPY